MDIPLFAPLTVAGALGLIVGFLAAVGVAARMRRRWGPERALWAVVIALAGFAATAVAVNSLEAAVLDLNPAVSDAELVGTWRWRQATLELGPRGEYTCAPMAACAKWGTRGRWTRIEKFHLAFAVPGEVEYTTRVVSFAGTLRLAEMDPEEFWPQRLLFQRRRPAS